MWKEIIDAHVKKGLDFVIQKVASGPQIINSREQKEIFVFYHFRDLTSSSDYENGDQECCTFTVPSIEVRTIKNHFPIKILNTSLSFRFKLEDKDFGYVWLDNLSDSDSAPTFRGSVHVQVNRFPVREQRVGPVVNVAPVREELIKQRLAAKEAQVRAAKEFVQSNAAEEANRRSDKLNAQNSLGQELDRWALTEQGKFKDVRSLLSSLGSVLWPNSGWVDVSMGELMMSGSVVKKMYRKAIILTHPDRHQQDSGEHQYRAERIFNALNESFKTFSTSS